MSSIQPAQSIQKTAKRLVSLGDCQLTLGSGSPRRKQLLEGLDLPFTVEPVDSLDEHNYPSTTPAHEIPQWLAEAKADAFGRPLKAKEVLLTADTLVFCEGDTPAAERILGKPKNASEAKAMISELSNTEHLVITGVNLRTGEGITFPDGTHQHRFSDVTTVRFTRLTEEEISFYVEQYRPFDKAGAYGAQEWIGYMGISKLEGSYFNVMGLPVQKIWEELRFLISFAG